MYIVTFYSFKGGVGRTMSMLNVALELTRRKRRVLVVDFDLEAPGVQTYAPFNEAAGTPGMVEYVTAFQRTQESPNVADYICPLVIDEETIWFMPSGKQDQGYPERFNAIDWALLYKEMHGYLMFEDLKQQWAEVYGFDYVLVDSRTGHTDISGICTRQLPDAVVLMFFPNEQNIDGLEQVVRGIRAETSSPRGKKIVTHFCPSNVPDLDDEDHILQRLLDDARHRLSYEDHAGLIHHYQSLSLLDQKIFVRDRPRSRLSSEYNSLLISIIMENFYDRDGILAKLDKTAMLIRQNKESRTIAEVDELLSKIYAMYASDGEVSWSLSQIFALAGNVEAELATLGAAIDAKFNESLARSRRATLLLRERRSSIAADDLRAVISLADASARDVARCVDLLRGTDPGWFPFVEATFSAQSREPEDWARIAESLMFERHSSKFAASLLSKAREGGDHPRIESPLALSLIGSGQFRAAMSLMGDRAMILQSNNVAIIFNYACAEWGAENSPPADLFARVIRLPGGDGRHEPNYAQCLAMAQWVLGKTDEAIRSLENARAAIEGFPITVFSCWRYLNVRSADFLADVDEMRISLIEGKAIEPPFVAAKAMQKVH